MLSSALPLEFMGLGFSGPFKITRAALGAGREELSLIDLSV